MYQFIESVNLKHGQLQHLALHNRRMNATRRHFFGSTDHLDLARYIPPLSTEHTRGWYKCRVIYSAQIQDVALIPYIPKPIHSLRLVEDNDINYRFKFEDRQALDRLFAQRGTCDDIIIVHQGLLTDSYYCNLLLYDGSHWVTPRSPLLGGVQRAYLLQQGLILEKAIHVQQLGQYQQIKLINAMLPPSVAPTVAISQVYS